MEEGKNNNMQGTSAPSTLRTAAGTELTPRDYQWECMQQIAGLDTGRVLVSLATGLGKTVIMAGAWGLIAKAHPDERLLILSHRDELVRQPSRYFDCSFGYEKASEQSKGEKVVSASVQTLSRTERLSRFEPDAFDVIFVDEAHHAAAPTYKKILKYFNPRLIVGFTATARRGDKVRLDDVFDSILFTRDTLWGIDKGWLCPLRAVGISTNADLSRIKFLAGDFQEKELSRRIEHSDMIYKAAAAYMKYCRGQDRQTLAYVVNVKLSHTLAATIQELLPDAEKDTVRVVTGKTPDEERKNILEAYKDGKVKCIVNCMVLTEGFDAPETSAILVMRPTCNDSLYQQIVGRGLRLAGDKENCLVLDIMPGSESPNHHICTALSLFGEDASMATRKQKQAMQQEYDLLEMVENVRRTADIFRKDVMDMELLQKEFNIFAEEQVANITESRMRDAPSELKGYHVHINPSAAERYEIQFAEVSVCFAEPDVLGNTILTIKTKRKDYCAPIRFDEASDYLGILSDATRGPGFYWDEGVYKEWQKQRITEKQAAYLKNAKEVSVGDPDSLTKAQASELVSLNARLSDIKRDLENRGIFYTPAKSQKKRDEQQRTALEAFRKYREESEQRKSMDPKELEEYIDAVRNSMTKDIAGKEQSRAAKAALWSIEGTTRTITVNVTQQYVMRKGNPASDKQLSFIKSLLADLEKKHAYVHHGTIPAPDDSMKAGALIAILKALNKEIPDVSTRRAATCRRLLIDARDVKKAMQNATPETVQGEMRITIGSEI